MFHSLHFAHKMFLNSVQFNDFSLLGWWPNNTAFISASYIHTKHLFKIFLVLKFLIITPLNTCSYDIFFSFLIRSLELQVSVYDYPPVFNFLSISNFLVRCNRRVSRLSMTVIPISLRWLSSSSSLPFYTFYCVLVFSISELYHIYLLWCSLQNTVVYAFFYLFVYGWYYDKQYWKRERGREKKSFRYRYI